jgi:hypothetical protein
MTRLLFTTLALAFIATGASIRDVDFKNFVYPFTTIDLPSVPSQLRWMPLSASSRVALRGGRYKARCDEPPCFLLSLDRVEFGDIDGLAGTTALVMVTFHTGGTATWQYLYVIALRAGKPQVIAWLETGSRADMGVRRASVDHGDLVLVVNDPAKREGDCCSTGSITLRYRWQDGSFRQIGAPVRKDDSQ